MLKLAANLSMLFTEMPLPERFAAAAAAGCHAVEIQYPYEWERAKIKRELERCGLKMVLFNLPPAILSPEIAARRPILRGKKSSGRGF